MWFSNLTKKQKNEMIKLLKEDGFNVTLSKSNLIAQKNDKKIVISKLENTKLVFNLKQWLLNNNLLAKNIDGFDVPYLLSFLESEKKRQESLIETLYRMSNKLNWTVSNKGSLDSDHELCEKINCDGLTYLEIETDLNKVFTIINLTNSGTEDFYAINKRFISFYRILNKIESSSKIEEYAPKTVSYLKTLGYQI